MDFIPNGNQREIDHKDSTDKAGSLVKRLGWESKHGMTVICSKKDRSSDSSENQSNSRYIRKADPTALANGLGVKGGGKREIFYDS